jgi:hypothetical protein
MNEDKIDLSGTFKQIKSLDWLRNVLDWAVSDLKTRSKAKNFEQRKKIAKNLENALHEFEISIGLRQEEKEEPQGNENFHSYSSSNLRALGILRMPRANRLFNFPQSTG